MLGAKFLGKGLAFTLLSSAGQLDRAREEHFRPELAALPPSRFDVALVFRLLDRMDQDLAIRSHIGHSLLAKFTDFGWRVPAFGNDRPVFGRLPIELPDGLDRAVAIAVFREEGVDLTIPGRRSLFAQVPEERRELFPATTRSEDRLLTLTVNISRPDPAPLATSVQKALSRLNARKR
jgi:hypothetical protein